MSFLPVGLVFLVLLLLAASAVLLLGDVADDPDPNRKLFLPAIRMCISIKEPPTMCKMFAVSLVNVLGDHSFELKPVPLSKR